MRNLPPWWWSATPHSLDRSTAAVLTADGTTNSGNSQPSTDTLHNANLSENDLGDRSERGRFSFRTRFKINSRTVSIIDQTMSDQFGFMSYKSPKTVVAESVSYLRG